MSFASKIGSLNGGDLALRRQYFIAATEAAGKKAERVRDSVLCCVELQAHISTFLDFCDGISFLTATKTIRVACEGLFESIVFRNWRLELFHQNVTVFSRLIYVSGNLFNDIAFSRALLPSPRLFLTQEEYQAETIRYWIDGCQDKLTANEQVVLKSWLGYLLFDAQKPSKECSLDLVELLIDQDRPDLLAKVLDRFSLKLEEEKGQRLREDYFVQTNQLQGTISQQYNELVEKYGSREALQAQIQELFLDKTKQIDQSQLFDLLTKVLDNFLAQLEAEHAQELRADACAKKYAGKPAEEGVGIRRDRLQRAIFEQYFDLVEKYGSLESFRKQIEMLFADKTKLIWCYVHLTESEQAIVKSWGGYLQNREQIPSECISLELFERLTGLLEDKNPLAARSINLFSQMRRDEETMRRFEEKPKIDLLFFAKNNLRLNLFKDQGGELFENLRQIKHIDAEIATWECEIRSLNQNVDSSKRKITSLERNCRSHRKELEDLKQYNELVEKHGSTEHLQAQMQVQIDSLSKTKQIDQSRLVDLLGKVLDQFFTQLKKESRAQKLRATRNQPGSEIREQYNKIVKKYGSLEVFQYKTQMLLRNKAELIWCYVQLAESKQAILKDWGAYLQNGGEIPSTCISLELFERLIGLSEYKNPPDLFSQIRRDRDAMCQFEEWYKDDPAFVIKNGPSQIERKIETLEREIHSLHQECDSFKEKITSLENNCREYVEERKDLIQRCEPLQKKNEQLVLRSLFYADYKKNQGLYDKLKNFWRSILFLPEQIDGHVNSLYLIDFINKNQYQRRDDEELYAEMVDELLTRQLWALSARATPKDEKTLKALLIRWEQQAERQIVSILQAQEGPLLTLPLLQNAVQLLREGRPVEQVLQQLMRLLPEQMQVAWLAQQIPQQLEPLLQRVQQLLQPKTFEQKKAILLNPRALKNRTQAIDLLFKTATNEQLAKCVEENPWLILKVIENGLLFSCIRDISEAGMLAINLEIQRLGSKISPKMIAKNGMGVITADDLWSFLCLKCPLLTTELKRHCDRLISGLDIQRDKQLCERLAQFYVDNNFVPPIAVIMKFYSADWFFNDSSLNGIWSTQFIDQVVGSMNSMNKGERSLAIDRYVQMQQNLSEPELIKIFSADCFLPQQFVSSMLTENHSKELRGLALLHWQGVPSPGGEPHIFDMSSEITTMFANGLEVSEKHLEEALLQTANEGEGILDKWLVYTESPEYIPHSRYGGAETGFKYLMAKRMWALLSSSQVTGSMVGKLLRQLTRQTKEQVLFDLIESIAAYLESKKLKIPFEDLLDILENYSQYESNDKSEKTVVHLVTLLQKMEPDNEDLETALLEGSKWIEATGGVAIVKALIRSIAQREAPLSAATIVAIFQSQFSIQLTKEASGLLRIQPQDVMESVFEQSIEQVAVFEKLWIAYNGKKALPISADLFSKLFSAALQKRPQLAIEILEVYKEPILSQVQIEAFIDSASKVTESRLAGLLQKITLEKDFEVKPNSHVNAVYRTAVDRDRQWFFEQASIRKQEGLTNFVLNIEQKIKEYEADWETLSTLQKLSYWFCRVLSAIVVGITSLIYWMQNLVCDSPNPAVGSTGSASSGASKRPSAWHG